MNDVKTKDQRIDFNDAPDLDFRDVNANVIPGGHGSQLIQIQSVNQNGEEGPAVMLDVAEAIALRDWLNQVLA